MRIILTLIVAVLVSAPSASLAQTSPSATVDDAAAAGWQALQDNNGELALRQFEAARRARPKDAVLQLGSGAAAHMLGRDDDAMQALRSALDQDPSLVIASKLLAEIAWQRGDLALAIDTYERALAHAPGNIEMASRLDRLQSESARRSSAAQLKISSTGPRQDPVVDRASRVLNGAYWQVARLVGAYPAEVISIELDATKPFQARVPAAVRVAANSAAGEGSAANGDAADRPICVNAKDALADAEAFDRVLTATLVQAMVNHMAPTGVPAWFPRGLAQVVAEELGASWADVTVQSAPVGGTFATGPAWLTGGSSSITCAGTALVKATKTLGDNLKQLAADARRALEEVNRAVRSLEKNPQQLIFGAKPAVPDSNNAPIPATSRG